MMTYNYKKALICQLLLYFCVTICTAQYPNLHRSNPQHRRTRNWSYLTQQTTRNTATRSSLFKKNVPFQNTINKSTKYEEYNQSRLRNQVKLTLYYESLCPGSIQYLTTILRPVVHKLAPYLDIRLVPYGHAKTVKINKGYQFECQHGPSECYGNRVHACAIDVIRNSTKSFLFNACLMEKIKYKNGIGYDYTSALIWCGDMYNISSDDMWPCVNTRRGIILQKRYGEETHALKQLPYVPYVLINGVEDDGKENIITVICRKLFPMPTVCRQRLITGNNIRSSIHYSD